MPKGNKLTVKQKRFAQEYAKDGNGTRAALEVYDTDDPNTANQIAIENLQKPTVKEEVDSLMAALDNVITPELVAEVHQAGLTATNKLIVNGEVVAEVEDHKTRHKFLDTYYKVKGKTGGNSNAGSGNTFNFIQNVSESKSKYAA